jgi:chromosome segregation ATPase
MASVGNKINKLVSTPDNDLTAELEIPAFFPDERERDDRDAEADTNTLEIKISGLKADPHEAPNGALKPGTHPRADSLDRLQVDIDQLRAKWTGLEQEIEERKKITDHLNAEINQLNEKLKTSLDELEQARQTAEQSSADIEQLRTAAEKDELRILDLEKQLATSNEKISSNELQLQESWSHQKEDHEKIAVRDRQIAELETQLAKQITECKELNTENSDLRDELQNDAAREIERSHKLIAEQTGLLAANEQDLGEFRAQIGRTERYADELRHKFQDQSEIATSAVGRMQDLQTNFESAQDKVSDLSVKLADTRKQSSVLSKKLSKIEKGFADEIRTIRFELGAAQDTIVGQDTINVQLTSDLYDNKGARQSLETQLEEADEQHQQTIRQLEQEANKLRNQAEDFEYKLENKDSAIAALMAELTKRSESIESIGEIENVIQEIDERISEHLDEEDTATRERVTRLLVGESDGQEVRFPLFKDRLTIGRTTNNDIQLNEPSISRRHAVIVTENGSTRLVDWGSKNGVYVNENRVAEQMLKNGDLVMIGMTEFRYEERPKR